MLIILLLLSLFFAPPALAVNCANVPISGNYTVDTACNFANTVDGVDAGTGTANTAVLTSTTGGSLTVGAGTTLAVGSLSLTRGNIIIINTGQIKIGAPLYATDADADAYPASITAFYTSADTGRVRRNTLTALTVDCNDAQTCVDGTYPATCKKCNTGCIVNEANGLTGYNCTATHYRCDGSGSCTAPTTTVCANPQSGWGQTCDQACPYRGYSYCTRGWGSSDCCGDDRWCGTNGFGGSYLNCSQSTNSEGHSNSSCTCWYYNYD